MITLTQLLLQELVGRQTSRVKSLMAGSTNASARDRPLGNAAKCVLLRLAMDRNVARHQKGRFGYFITSQYVTDCLSILLALTNLFF
jgi:hypothetical protein